MSFSRSIKAAQSSLGLPTAILWMPARPISCRAWPAATRTFFGVQPRFGQVPPRSRASIMATDMPARRTGPVTAIPALPPPRITTSNFSGVMDPPRSLHATTVAAHSPCAASPCLLFVGDRRRDRIDDHGRHLELRGAILDVVTLRDPIEVGPDRPDVAVVVLGEEQADGPV